MTTKATTDEHIRIKLEHLQLIGEFQVVEEQSTDRLSIMSSIKIPNANQTKMPLQDKPFTGKAIEIFPEIYTGDDSIVTSAVFEFNQEQKGWHYAWVGSRFKSNIADHVFSVGIYLQKGSSSGTISSHKLAAFRSPQFKIASLRRNKEKQKQDLKLPAGKYRESKDTLFNPLTTGVYDGHDEVGLPRVHNPHELEEVVVLNYGEQSEFAFVFF
jgi:hypothetical protein